MSLPAHATLVERLWRVLFLAACALIFLFLIAPIVVIIPLAFNAEPYFTFTEKMLALDPEGYSLRWFRDLATDPEWSRSILNSFIYAIFSSLLATALGTLAALGLSRPHMPARAAITAVLISPMIVPIIITAAAMFSFYARLKLGVGDDAPSFLKSYPYLTTILAHTLIGAPFVVITVTAALSGFDHSLTRAAQSLGAGQRETFFKVILPLLLPGVISGALFAFVASLDEVVLAVFLTGPAESPMTVRMFSGLREEIKPTILALAVVLVAISIALLTMLELLRRRGERLRGMSPG